jgi:hypothetical protein
VTASSIRRRRAAWTICQQATVQDDDLFTEHPPDDEQRLHQYRQVGDIPDKLLDAGLELHRSDLEAEVAQSTSQIVRQPSDWVLVRKVLKAPRAPRA